MKVGELFQNIKMLAQVIETAGSPELVERLEAIADALTGSEAATVGAFIKKVGAAPVEAGGDGVRLRTVLPVFEKFKELIKLNGKATTVSDLTTFIDFITAHQDATIQAFGAACRMPQPAKPVGTPVTGQPKPRRVRTPATAQPRQAKEAPSREKIQEYVDLLHRSYKEPVDFKVIVNEIEKMSAAGQISIAREFLLEPKIKSGKDALKGIKARHADYIEREREDKVSQGRSAA